MRLALFYVQTNIYLSLPPSLAHKHWLVTNPQTWPQHIRVRSIHTTLRITVAAMTTFLNALRLLHAEVDEGDEDSHLRLLHKNKHVKYVTVAAGVYMPDDMCFEPTITALLEPLLPPGQWNYGYITRDPTTGLPHFAEVAQKQFASVTSIWHPTTIDHLDLVLGESLKPGVYDATCPRLELPAVAKFACWDWEISCIDNESAAYQWLEGHNIGPRFLGHISEEGRVIGFLTERVMDGDIDARHATAADLEACSQALKKLHHLGILHGDVYRYNILMTNNGATLMDFANARKSDDSSAFEEELQLLEERLNSELGKPGGRFLEESDFEPYTAPDDSRAAETTNPPVL